MSSNISFLDDLLKIKNYKVKQESSYDRNYKNKDFIKIDAGEVVKIFTPDKPGCIVRIWITLASPDPFIMRNALLKIYWDDEENPSVEAPIGDFFGCGFVKYVHHSSFLLGATSGGFFSYFPMPYNRCRIEIHNQSKMRIESFYYAIQYQEFKEQEKYTLRFHSKWKREKTEKGKNYTIMEARGTGHYIGCNLYMRGVRPFSLWFLEGNEMIYVDGENIPSIQGTGTEDYFNSGWYFNKGCFCAPFHGCTVKNWIKPVVFAYRFHISDAIPFSSEIKVTIQHGGTNDVPGCDYSSVAYWYQNEPHYEFYKIPDADERMPILNNLEKLNMQIKKILLQTGFFIWNNIIVKVLKI